MRQPTKSHRSTFTPEERAQWISRFRSSGLTQVQFVQQCGLKLKTFRGWLYRQRRQRVASTVPQKTRTPKPKPPTATFRELKAAALWSDSASAEWMAEVTWPGGVTVRLGSGAEASWVEVLLRAVRQAC
jgi:hypothetical protein